MNEPKRIPINRTPDWVRGIVDQEEIFPEELTKAKASGNQFYRAIRAKNGNFLICYDQETGEATDIIWL